MEGMLHHYIRTLGSVSESEMMWQFLSLRLPTVYHNGLTEIMGLIELWDVFGIQIKWVLLLN